MRKHFYNFVTLQVANHQRNYQWSNKCWLKQVFIIMLIKLIETSVFHNVDHIVDHIVWNKCFHNVDDTFHDEIVLKLTWKPAQLVVKVLKPFLGTYRVNAMSKHFYNVHHIVIITEMIIDDTSVDMIPSVRLKHHRLTIGRLIRENHLMKYKLCWGVYSEF